MGFLRVFVSSWWIGPGLYHEDESARQLMARIQAAVKEVDRAGPLHNPEFAGAVYERIVKLATDIGKPQMNTDEHR